MRKSKSQFHKVVLLLLLLLPVVSGGTMSTLESRQEGTGTTAVEFHEITAVTEAFDSLIIFGPLKVVAWHLFLC